MAQEHLTYPAEACDILQFLFKELKINDHTLHFAASFSGELDPGLLRKAVALSAEAFPLIRCRFGSAGGRLRWRETGRPADLVSFSETEHAAEETERFLCAALDEAAGPQIKFGLFRQDGKDTLAVRMNHMLCDAAGFKEYLYLVCGIYTGLENHEDVHPPASGSRRLGQLLRPFSVRDRIRILAGKNDMLTHDPERFDLEGDLANPFIERRTIPRDSFLRMAAFAKSRHATVNDLLLAALIRVLSRLFGRPVAVPCAVDLRKYLPGRKAEGFCNLVTNLTCDVGEEPGASFGQTLDRVRRAMDRQKASPVCLKSMILLEKIFDLLPYKAAKYLFEKNFSNAPIAFTNLGVLDDGRLRFGMSEITGAYMTGSIKYSPYFQMAVSTFRNQPTLSVNLYGTPSDRKMVSGVLDDVILELGTIA